jgi:hypothetical protein
MYPPEPKTPRPTRTPETKLQSMTPTHPKCTHIGFYTQCGTWGGKNLMYPPDLIAPRSSMDKPEHKHMSTSTSTQWGQVVRPQPSVYPRGEGLDMVMIVVKRKKVCECTRGSYSNKRSHDCICLTIFGRSFPIWTYVA